MLNDQRVRKTYNNLNVISRNVGVEIQEQNIEEAYFLNKNYENKSSKSIIVKFNFTTDKDKLKKAKHKFKDAGDTNSIYVNDLLDMETLNLLKNMLER